MFTMIAGAQNSFKTTSVVGNEDYGVKGLNPNNTLIVVPGLKELPDYFDYIYQPLVLDIADSPTIPKFLLEKGSKMPIKKNFLAISTGDLGTIPKPGSNESYDIVDVMLTYIKTAITHGYKDSSDVVHDITTIIVDDLQMFMNDTVHMRPDMDWSKFNIQNYATLRLFKTLKAEHIKAKSRGKGKEDVDIFILSHMTPEKPGKKRAFNNPIKLDFTGNTFKGRYSVDGYFNNLWYSEGGEFITAPEPGLEVVRTQYKLLPPGTARVKADLYEVKKLIKASRLLGKTKYSKNPKTNK